MLTARLNGRLGNQMFEIASTIGIAYKLGLDFGFERDETPFENPLPTVDYSRPYSLVKVKWGYHNIVPVDYSILDGYMQSEKYFSHCAFLVRHYFKLKKLSDIEIPENAVCVHIRLGDYKKSTVHPVCSKDYYYRAFGVMPSGSDYYIFSDEPDLAKEMFPFFHIMRNDLYTDLYLMTKFKRHIIANSSFSWWGAWLADSLQVVAPQRWFGNDLSIKDLIPERWILK